MTALARNRIFTLPGGQEIFTRDWRPPAIGSEAVLCLHGVESHSEWFEEIASALVARNVSVCAFDRPGWGRSAGKRGHLASRDELVSQIVEVASHLHREFDSVCLAGLSWGGLAALYATLHRWPFFDSLVLIAPGICPKIGLPFQEKLRVAARLVSGSSRPVPLSIPVEAFTRRPDRTDYIRKDPLRTTRVSATFCVETLQMRRLIHKRLHERRLPPTQLFLAGQDALIDNSATSALFLNHDVRISTFKDAFHSLVFEDPARVAREILDFNRSVRLKQSRKSILIMGAGAVGSTVGSLLALRGHNVTLAARPAQVEAAQGTGTTLHLAEGRRRITSGIRFLTLPAKQLGPADLVFLTVKSYDTDRALCDLREVVGPKTVLISLQNGLDNEPRIASAFPENPIVAAAICGYMELLEPGQVRWWSEHGGIAAAIHSGGPQDDAVAWADTLRDTGMPMHLHHPPSGDRSIKWSKLILNLGFNVLNAVTGLTAAGIYEHQHHGTLAVRALREGFQVMRKLHIEPVDLPGYRVRNLARLVVLPTRVSRPILARIARIEPPAQSSMAQDLSRGHRLTEIDHINGAVVRTGTASGVPTPANSRLCEMLLEQSGAMLRLDRE